MSANAGATQTQTNYTMPIVIVCVIIIMFCVYKSKSAVDEIDAEVRSQILYGDGSVRPEKMKDAEKTAFNQAQCSQLSVGSDMFSQIYRIDRVLNEATEGEGENLKQFAMKGVTPKYGIGWGCQLDKEKGACVENSYFYDLNKDNDDRFYSPENLFDSSSLGYDDYYEKDMGDGKIRGMTGAEAANECFGNKGCGSVVLPACERGFLFMSKSRLNELLEKNAGKFSNQEKWVEKSEFWKEGNKPRFRKSACVQVKSGASISKETKPEDVKDKILGLLDFGSIRSLNFDSDATPNRPVRAAYYFPKSKISGANTTGSGPGSKIVSDRVSLNIANKASESRNVGIDAYMVQGGSGNAKGDYSHYKNAVAKGTNPCEISQLSYIPKLTKMCQSAVGEDWDPGFECPTRDTRLRDRV